MSRSVSGFNAIVKQRLDNQSCKVIDLVEEIVGAWVRNTGMCFYQILLILFVHLLLAYLFLKDRFVKIHCMTPAWHIMSRSVTWRISHEMAFIRDRGKGIPSSLAANDIAGRYL